MNFQRCKFFLQRQCQRPSSIQVPGRIAVSARRGVNKKLDHDQQLRPFGCVAPKDVRDQHTQNFLELLVRSLNDALLHRAPCRPELLPCSQQGNVLLHEYVLKFDAAVAPQHRRQRAGPEHTASERSPHFRARQVGARFKEHGVTEATNIRHHVLVAFLVRWV